MDSPLPRTEALLNIPKHSLDTFEIKNSYYIVEDEATHRYHYFPIRVDSQSENEHIIRFSRTPPVLMEGLAIIDKKIYHVPLSDLKRLIIRKSRLIGEKVENGSNSSTIDISSGTISLSSGDGTATRPRKTVSSLDESGSGTEAGLEESRAPDDAFEEQIQALLHSISEKEGGQWEITDIAQS